MTFCKKLYIKYIMWLHILICGFLRCKKGCEFKMSLICVDNLSKTFRVSRRSSGLKAALRSFVKRDYTYVNAVDNISFNINEGEIVGYIGPNGAGKSTTIKMLSGILLPSSGKINVDGLNPSADRKKYVKRIGVVFGQRSQLEWDIPAEDTFDLLRDIYSLDEDEYLKTKNELVKLLEIEEIIKKPVRTLSLRERMRCELCASLLHKPKILFLDEPTIGLDAKSKVIVRNFIEKINKKNHVTVILTTHDMSDIEALAKRIILIGKGKILYDGAIDSLKKKYGSYKTVSIITRDRIENIEFNGIVKRKFCDGVYKFVIDTNIITISSFINYVSNSYNLEDLDVDNETIDDIILKLYEDYNV